MDLELDLSLVKGFGICLPIAADMDADADVREDWHPKCIQVLGRRRCFRFAGVGLPVLVLT
eukprot:5875988-Pyramimonas_sp.AAC.1